MNLTRLVLPGLPEKILAAVPHDRPLAAIGIMLGLAAAAAAYRLLAEWQRRVTFDHIFTRAPGGSVIVQEAGKAGPAMWIWVGSGERPQPAPVERIYIVTDRYAMLPPGNRAGRSER